MAAVCLSACYLTRHSHLDSKYTFITPYTFSIAWKQQSTNQCLTYPKEYYGGFENRDDGELCNTAHVWGPVRKKPKNHLQEEENERVIVSCKKPSLAEGWSEESPGPQTGKLKLTKRATGSSRGESKQERQSWTQQGRMDNSARRGVTNASNLGEMAPKHNKEEWVLVLCKWQGRLCQDMPPTEPPQKTRQDYGRDARGKEVRLWKRNHTINQGCKKGGIPLESLQKTRSKARLKEQGEDVI